MLLNFIYFCILETVGVLKDLTFLKSHSIFLKHEAKDLSFAMVKVMSLATIKSLYLVIGLLDSKKKSPWPWVYVIWS